MLNFSCIRQSQKGGFSTMKRSRFTEQQIAFVLHQAEQGTTVGEITGKIGLGGLRPTSGQYFPHRPDHSAVFPKGPNAYHP